MVLVIDCTRYLLLASQYVLNLHIIWHKKLLAVVDSGPHPAGNISEVEPEQRSRIRTPIQLIEQNRTKSNDRTTTIEQ